MILIQLLSFGKNSMAQCDMGFSGYITVPNSVSYPDGQILISAHYINKQRINYLSGNFDVMSYSMVIAYLPNMEILFRLIHPLNLDNFKFGLGDRSLGIKYIIPELNSYIPSFCIAVNDILHLINSDTGNASFNSYFIIMGKSFKYINSALKLQVDIGYAGKLGNSEYSQFNGVIFGLGLEYHNAIKLDTEYDSKTINIGVKMNPLEFMSTVISLMNYKYINVGVAVNFSLK